jgi:hypothetical protein
MPETGFVLTGFDELALTQEILKMGAVLVPDLRYPDDRPVQIAIFNRSLRTGNIPGCSLFCTLRFRKSHLR